MGTSKKMVSKGRGLLGRREGTEPVSLAWIRVLFMRVGGGVGGGRGFGEGGAVSSYLNLVGCSYIIQTPLLEVCLTSILAQLEPLFIYSWACLVVILSFRMGRFSLQGCGGNVSLCSVSFLFGRRLKVALDTPG